MTQITSTMSIALATIHAIFENPNMGNKEVSAVIRSTHGGSTEKTVAWYRSHARRGTLKGKELTLLVERLGGRDAVPSAAPSRSGTSVRTLSPEQMAQALAALGWKTSSPVQTALEGVTLDDAVRDLEAAYAPSAPKTELRKARK